MVKTIWQHRSFLTAVYHLLVVDLSGHSLLRRCPSCRRFFQPKRDSTYCSERCYDRQRKEAQETLTEALSELRQGMFIPPAKITVKEFLAGEWLPAIKTTICPATYASY